MWIPTEEEKIGVGESIAPVIVNLRRLLSRFLIDFNRTAL